MYRLISILLVILPMISHGQDSLLANMMTFQQYITLVKQHHPMSQQARLNKDLGDAYLSRSKGVFDPVLTGNANQKYFNQQQYYSIINGQLKIPTWFGVSFNSGYDINSGAYLNPERTLPDAGLWYAGLNVALGKGLIIDERRAEYKKAQIFAESALQQQIILLNELYLEASMAYWDWCKSYNKLLVYQDAVDNANTRFENIKQSAIAGDKPFIDTLEAHVQLQRWLYHLLDAELEYLNSTALLEIYMWQDGYIPVELDTTIIPPAISEISINNVNPEIALRVDSLKNSHPELLLTQYKINQKKVDIDLSRNNLLPDINLKYNALTHAGDGDLSDNFSLNNYTWGAQVKIPLLLRKERNDLRINKVKLEMLQNDLEFKREQVEYKIEASLNTWATSYEQLKLWQQTTQNYKQLLESEEVLFKIGESSLFMVNSREQAYIKAQLKLIDTMINNKKAALKSLYAFGVIHNEI